MTKLVRRLPSGRLRSLVLVLSLSIAVLSDHRLHGAARGRVQRCRPQRSSRHHLLRQVLRHRRCRQEHLGCGVLRQDRPLPRRRQDLDHPALGNIEGPSGGQLCKRPIGLGRRRPRDHPPHKGRRGNLGKTGEHHHGSAAPQGPVLKRQGGVCRGELRRDPPYDGRGRHGNALTSSRKIPPSMIFPSQSLRGMDRRRIRDDPPHKGRRQDLGEAAERAGRKALRHCL